MKRISLGFGFLQGKETVHNDGGRVVCICDYGICYLPFSSVAFHVDHLEAMEVRHRQERSFSFPRCH